MSAYDNIEKLPEHIIFREPNPENEGVFILHRSLFIIDGINTPKSGRCDNLMYNVELPTINTPYHNEGIYVGEKAYYDDFFFSIHNVSRGVQIIDDAPDFAITYVKFCEYNTDGFRPNGWHIQNGSYPAAMWFGGSLIELFKNMREWSFMLDEPFNSDHPMAVYSKMVFDTFETPQWVFDEIDSLPDMHLAKFLKGQEDYRDLVIDFPQMSTQMQDWFREKMELFPRITTRQRLRDLVI
jgi:hypothetical protein